MNILCGNIKALRRELFLHIRFFPVVFEFHDALVRQRMLHRIKKYLIRNCRNIRPGQCTLHDMAGFSDRRGNNFCFYFV